VTPLRVLVADDERMARSRVVRLLGALEGVAVARECERGDEVLAALREESVDVLLLDIQMPGLSGMEAVRLLPEPRPYVIFCTAYAEHAALAFEVGAVDYLLKPVEAGRLATAIDRARRAVAPAARAGAALRKLAIETQQGVVLLDPAEISHAELDDALVTIHVGDRQVLTDLSLSTLEERLPRGMFLRVHRRALLNLDHVTLLEPNKAGGYVARTRGRTSVEVSRQAARELRRALGVAKSKVGEDGDG
jgi:two-component system LytT family response regulator